MLMNTTMTLSREDLKVIMLVMLKEMRNLDMELKETKKKRVRDEINNALEQLSEIQLKLEKTLVDLELEIAEMEER